jgi:hypothetical protein
VDGMGVIVEAIKQRIAPRPARWPQRHPRRARLRSCR